MDLTDADGIAEGVAKGEAAEDVNRRLLRARDRMDSSYRDPLTIDELARVALMAPTHFIREFKRVLGEPPYPYLQRRRVERALRALTPRPGVHKGDCGGQGHS